MIANRNSNEVHTLPLPETARETSGSRDFSPDAPLPPSAFYRAGRLFNQGQYEELLNLALLSYAYCLSVKLFLTSVRMYQGDIPYTEDDKLQARRLYDRIQLCSKDFLSRDKRADDVFTQQDQVQDSELLPSPSIVSRKDGHSQQIISVTLESVYLNL